MFLVSQLTGPDQMIFRWLYQEIMIMKNSFVLLANYIQDYRLFTPSRRLTLVVDHMIRVVDALSHHYETLYGFFLDLNLPNAWAELDIFM